MRVSKRVLEAKVRTLNVALGRPVTAYTRTEERGYRASIGNLHISSSSPGDGCTRYELHEMMSEVGGVRVIGNRCFLGAAAFDDFLTGFAQACDIFYPTVQVCRDVMTWASTPGNHGGNPYGHAFVKGAESAIARIEGKE